MQNIFVSNYSMHNFISKLFELKIYHVLNERIILKNTTLFEFQVNIHVLYGTKTKNYGTMELMYKTDIERSQRSLTYYYFH